MNWLRRLHIWSIGLVLCSSVIAAEDEHLDATPAGSFTVVVIPDTQNYIGRRTRALKLSFALLALVEDAGSGNVRALAVAFRRRLLRAARMFLITRQVYATRQSHQHLG